MDSHRSEIRDSILAKLLKDKARYQKQLAETKLKIELYIGTTSLMELIEELERKVLLLRWKIDEIDIQIEVVEKEKNGNASLDPHLNNG